ncbi:hypothetical protein [Streptomyces sp. NPDC047869]|uniref:hypothetical protein n=1 Tax=Streptomyces sp. NPDC047869 TaxID=3154709 RepID=UPI003453E669
MSTIPDAQQARRSEDGPRPEVWTWPRTDRPALRVMSGGKWRHAPVLARQNDEVDLLGDALRVARESGSELSRSAAGG